MYPYDPVYLRNPHVLLGPELFEFGSRGAFVSVLGPLRSAGVYSVGRIGYPGTVAIAPTGWRWGFLGVSKPGLESCTCIVVVFVRAVCF